MLPLKKKKRKKVKGKPKLKQGYYAVVKVKGKYKKVNKGKLSKSGAKDLMTDTLDNTTSRSGTTRKGKRVKKFAPLKRGEKGAFSRKKKKLRSTKVKKGVKRRTPKKYVEKRKYAIDTKGEKKGLSVAKYIKRRKRKVVKKRISKKKVTKRRGKR